MKLIVPLVLWFCGKWMNNRYQDLTFVLCVSVILKLPEWWIKMCFFQTTLFTSTLTPWGSIPLFCRLKLHTPRSSWHKELAESDRSYFNYILAAIARLSYLFYFYWMDSSFFIPSGSLGQLPASVGKLFYVNLLDM